MRSAASRALGFFCALAFALTLATPALAAHFRKGETFVVPEGETLDDDLYAVGATVAINGTVNGDVMVVARTVIIRGTVTGSVRTLSRPSRFIVSAAQAIARSRFSDPLSLLPYVSVSSARRRQAKSSDVAAWIRRVLASR